MGMKSKFCHKCGKSKLLREFSGHNETKDKKQTQCKECQHKIYLKRYYKK